MARRWRIAMVVQRYGEEVSGGAELHARWLAEHLLELADVEVLTTCALDYTTWADHYPAGTSELNGVIVHRFPVDAPRNWPLSQKLTFRLLSREHSVLDEIEWIRQQGPISTPLFQALTARRDTYDAFIFFTYLYATTFFGLPLVPDKALLVPTAHDEPYLKLPLFRPTFHLPQVIIYNTQAEKEMVNNLMRNDGPAQIVAGVGINVPEESDGRRFRRNFGIEDEFLLYVGRVDQAKNVPELMDFFRLFREQHPDPLKLVLIGKANIPILSHPDIIHLGFLPEQDKFDALAAANTVIVPSLYESLSMIALEAWWMGRPVLVNGRCEILKQQCRHSNGGLYYHIYEEFQAALNLLLADSQLRQTLGRQGRRFVAHNYRWDIIAAKYQAIFDSLLGRRD
jgi:glycosyltransferase involved in cell wall biosynthesis